MTFLIASDLEKINCYYHCSEYIENVLNPIFKLIKEYKKFRNETISSFGNTICLRLFTETEVHLIQLLKIFHERKTDKILASLYGIQNFMILFSRFFNYKGKSLDQYLELYKWNEIIKPVTRSLFTLNQKIDDSVIAVTKFIEDEFVLKFVKKISKFNFDIDSKTFEYIEKHFKKISISFDYLIWKLKSQFKLELFKSKRFKVNSKSFIDILWQQYCFSKLTIHFFIYLNKVHLHSFPYDLNQFDLGKFQSKNHLKCYLEGYRFNNLYKNRNDVARRYTFLYLVLKSNHLPRDVIFIILGQINY